MPRVSDPIDGFINAVRTAGSPLAILAWQDEWDLTDQHGFGPVRRVRLLAYADGEVIAADVAGDACDRDAILARLQSAGLRVELRSRNRAS
jgi:hypothetical protein